MKLHDDLGLPEDADGQAIHTAHRALVRKHHPDQDGGDADAFRRVQHAYDVLSDPEKRAHYERTGDDGAPAGAEEAARQAALSLISGHVLGALTDDAAAGVDMQRAVMSKLSMGLGQLRTQLAQKKREIDRATRNRKRWKAKKADTLGPVFDAQLYTLRHRR